LKKRRNFETWLKEKKDAKKYMKKDERKDVKTHTKKGERK
jgi:hypothetical protein